MRPRRIAQAFLFLTACSSDASPDPQGTGTVVKPKVAETRTLQIQGIAVTVPPSFVTLEQDQLRKLESAAATQDPNTKLELAAMRAQTPLDGSVQVHRVVSTQSRVGMRTVREALEVEAATMKKVLSAPPAKPIEFQTTPKENAIEACGTTQLEQAGVVVETRTCALMYMTPEHAVVALDVVCTGEATRSKDACTAIVASRQFTPGSALPLEDELPPPPPEPTQLVQIPRMSIQAPASLVPDAELTKQMRDAMAKAGPGSKTELAMLLAPKTAPMMVVQLQSTIARAQDPRLLTVRQALDLEIAAFKKSLNPSGDPAPELTVTNKDETLEACFKQQSKGPKGTIEGRGCAVFYIEPDGTTVILMALCAAAPERVQHVCEPVLATRKLEIGKHLPLTTKLGAAGASNK